VGGSASAVDKAALDNADTSVGAGAELLIAALTGLVRSWVFVGAYEKIVARLCVRGAYNYDYNKKD
jgi:hypothetical protein